MSRKIATRCPQVVDNSGAISTGGELVKRGFGVIRHLERAPIGKCPPAAKDQMNWKGLANK
jgi:hypothetical protein